MNNPKITIEVRRYMPGEEKALQEIYYESTRRLNSKDYIPEQIERWVAKHSDLDEWSLRIANKNPFVATVENQPIAFAELEKNGQIDFFYCHPDWQGRGAGRELMIAITDEAKKLGLKVLHAEVSVTAEPFFSRQGFEIIEERSPIICGAPAKQYIMRKDISEKLQVLKSPNSI